MTDDVERQKKLLNAAGYLLQLGLEYEVQRTANEHGWEVVSREHPWKSGTSSGFSDLILAHGIVRLVIECKRPREGSWLFLVPEGSTPTEKFRCHWSHALPNQADLLGWADVWVTPACDDSAFCIVRGTGEGDQTLLERLANQLLASLPSLALEELGTTSWTGVPTELVHVPVIVTTAELNVARYQGASIDIRTGTLEDARIESVPFIRFRKSLAHGMTATASIVNLSSIAKDKERSILVVGASHLTALLTEFRLGYIQGYPWQASRQQENRST